MLAIDTSGVEAYVAWLENKALRIPLVVSQIYRDWALAIHAEITELTPQWSGNLAANWMLDIGGPTTAATYIAGEDADQPFTTGGRGETGPMFSRGMEPAVSISLERARQVTLPGLGESFYIHNPVAYADAIEDDTSEPSVRAINRLPRSEAGKIAMVHHAEFKHSQDGKALLNDLPSRTI